MEIIINGKLILFFKIIFTLYINTNLEIIIFIKILFYEICDYLLFISFQFAFNWIQEQFAALEPDALQPCVIRAAFKESVLFTSSR